ncbi:DUF397 domain-containing protein [Actinopolyspora erythraea]|uniref:DUF397 domain-containing protein n=1 Tax=Actinopolyspora erythraea TaxID=414996 RepID=A0A099D1W7_9ACTN|nr:DUF397 domain-containing protein [Actinopolyspora erythraea]ASU78050.1 DUF397 domain-containing protein [Actinopolyspora erythraea]KGI79817.1 hypothetical protein IL38_21740 [Actinopolyspora erythraea]
MSPEPTVSDWFVSSYSGGNNNNCVEVRFTNHGTEVRDTKNRTAGTLAFGTDRWSAFLRALRG